MLINLNFIAAAAIWALVPFTFLLIQCHHSKKVTIQKKKPAAGKKKLQRRQKKKNKTFYKKRLKRIASTGPSTPVITHRAPAQSRRGIAPAGKTNLDHEQAASHQLPNKPTMKPRALFQHQSPVSSTVPSTTPSTSPMQQAVNSIVEPTVSLISTKERRFPEPPEPKPEEQLMLPVFNDRFCFRPLQGELPPEQLFCPKHFLQKNFAGGTHEKQQKLRDRKHELCNLYRLDAKSARKKGERAEFGTPSGLSSTNTKSVRPLSPWQSNVPAAAATVTANA